MNNMKVNILLLITISIIIIICTPIIYFCYFDPDTVKFVSVDSVTPGGGVDSQGLNRYSYCLNNPVKYVDLKNNVEEQYGL